MICPVLLKYPDEFISNTKFVRNSSTNPDTPTTRVSDVHDTSGMIFPPPDTLSGNHPEPVFHPRMNSSSELIASYYARSSFAFHLSCHALVAMIAVYLLFLPPFISGRPRCYRRLHCCRVRLRRRRQYPYHRASRQAVPHHLSLISPIYLYLSIALGIAAATLQSYSTA